MKMDKNQWSALAAHIVKARKEKKMTQAQLARAIGKNVSSVQKYESGSVVPPYNVLKTIADVLECNFLVVSGVIDSIDYHHDERRKLTRFIDEKYRLINFPRRYPDDEIFIEYKDEEGIVRLLSYSQEQLCEELEGIKELLEKQMEREMKKRVDNLMEYIVNNRIGIRKDEIR